MSSDCIPDPRMSMLHISVILATLVSARGSLSADSARSLVSNKGPGSCGSAEESEVEGCLKPMLEYATKLQSNGLIPLEGMQIFDELCGFYRDFQRCTDGFGCRSISMDAMEASYGYMCGEGFSLFRKHVTCFAEVEQENQYLKCKDIATGAVNGLEFNPSASTEYFNELCSVMQSYLNCSRPIINLRCGEDAWALVTKVTKESLRVTMPTCDLKPYLDSTEEEKELLAKKKKKL